MVVVMAAVAVDSAVEGSGAGWAVADLAAAGSVVKAEADWAGAAAAAGLTVVGWAGAAMVEGSPSPYLVVE